MKRRFKILLCALILPLLGSCSSLHGKFDNYGSVTTAETFSARYLSAMENSKFSTTDKIISTVVTVEGKQTDQYSLEHGSNEIATYNQQGRSNGTIKYDHIRETIELKGNEKQSSKTIIDEKKKSFVEATSIYQNEFIETVNNSRCLVRVDANEKNIVILNSSVEDFSDKQLLQEAFASLLQNYLSITDISGLVTQEGSKFLYYIKDDTTFTVVIEESTINGRISDNGDLDNPLCYYNQSVKYVIQSVFKKDEIILRVSQSNKMSGHFAKNCYSSISGLPFYSSDLFYLNGDSFEKTASTEYFVKIKEQSNRVNKIKIDSSYSISNRRY